MLMGLFLIYNGVSKKQIRSFILHFGILVDYKYRVEKGSTFSTADWRTGPQVVQRAMSRGLERLCTSLGMK